MTVQSKTNLQTRADQVRNETAGFANDESRVGGLLRDMVDSSISGVNGAAGDGVTNDYAALQTAITAYSGKVLDMGGLTYKCNSPLNLSTGITLQNGTIDLSGIPASGIGLLANGSLGSTVALTSDLAYGSRSLVVNTTGIAAGDWLLITSTTVWGSTGGGVIGELARVRTISSGSALLLETPACSTYTTAATATIQRLGGEYQNIVLRDLTLIGGGPGLLQEATRFIHSMNVTLERVNSRAFDYAHHEFYGSVNGRVLNCDMREATAAGLSYGVVVQRGCRDVEVSHSYFSRFRHGCTIGGSAWVNRYIKFHANHVDFCGDAGFDSHTNSQFCQFTDNTIVCNDNSTDWAGNGDGMMMQGADAIISNNTIYRPAGSGIVAQNFVTGADKSPGHVITGNTIVDAGDIGLYVLNQGQTMSGVTVTGNTVRGARGANGAIYVYALTGSICRWTVTGNTVVDSIAPGIFTRGTSTIDGGINCYDGVVSANSIYLSTTGVASDGILALTVKRVTFSANDIEISNTARHGIDASGTIECSFLGNRIKLPAASTGTCLLLTGTGSDALVDGNQGKVGANGLSLSNTHTNCWIGPLNDFSGCTAPVTVGTGTGNRRTVLESVGTDVGNGSATVIAGEAATTQVWNTPIGANRLCTLSTTRPWNGAHFRVVRTAAATGAFTVDVGTGPLKSLAAGQWCIVEYDLPNGAAWRLVEFGSL